MKPIETLSALILAGMVSTGCGTKPDEKGKCALSCGNAIIGANDPAFKIVTWANNTKISCAAAAQGQTLKEPITLQFLAYRDLGPNGGNAHQPVPSMAFSPSSSSAVFQVKPNQELCSDACGVMSVDYQVTCPKAGSVFDVSVYVNSGALRSDIVTVSIETEKPVDTTTSPSGSPSPTPSPTPLVAPATPPAAPATPTKGAAVGPPAHTDAVKKQFSSNRRNPYMIAEPLQRSLSPRLYF